MATGKTIALTRQIFVGNVISLLLNTLSRFVVAFLPVSKRLLFSWLLPPCAMILEPTKIKSVTVSTVSASICHDWWDRMPWSSFFECWVLSQLLHFPLLLSIKRLFSSSLLSAIRVVSFSYLRLFIFLLAILIPAYTSSSLAFCMMYSAYKLNKQGDNLQPWCTPFPIWNKAVVHVQF